MHHCLLHLPAPFALPLALTACLACGVGLADEASSQAGDEAAIRQRAKDYLAAIERGDGEEIASFWTADGDYVDDAGQAVNGRRLAQRTGDRSDEQGDGGRLAVTVVSIRFITPDVAIEDGALGLPSAPSGEPVVRRYTAIWARQDGKWMLDGVRELAARAGSHADHLSALSWMLGEWISDDEQHSVQLTCARSADGHFLLREIEVGLPGREPLRVTQRIGWDAHDRQIKSWTFDSEGGHGDGLWFHQDGRWIVEAAGVLPNGSIATGTNVFAADGEDSFVWESANAEIDGEPSPNHKVRMVRKAAEN